MNIDLSTGLQICVLVFSVGAAWGSWKLVGAKVDALTKSFDEWKKEVGTRLDETDQRADGQSERINTQAIGLAEARKDVGYLQRVLSPYRGTPKQGGGE